MTGSLRLQIGRERIVMRDGLQPFLFRSDRGTLVVQAQLPNPPRWEEFPGKYATVRSANGGRTWRRWRPAAGQGQGPFTEGAIAPLRDGAILALEWMARGPDRRGDFVGKLWESRDDWRTLAGPVAARFHLPQAKGGHDDMGEPAGGVFLHRSMVELPGGDLVATAYCWFNTDRTPSAYMPTMNRFRSVLLRSADRGRHWRLVSTIAVDPSVGEEAFNEPVLVRLSRGKHRGRFIVQMRTGSNKAYPPERNLVHQAESDDEGRTWSRPRPLPWHGVNPDLIELRRGVLVAGFGWRSPESRAVPPLDNTPGQIGVFHGNWLAFSFDQGATWPQLQQVTHEPSTCYVTVREIAPDTLFLVYDKGDHWTRRWAAYPRARCAIAGRMITLR